MASPQDFLRDARGRLAAQRLFALEGVGLHFVEAELEFPALVVERDELGGGIGHGIEQRGEQGLGAEAAALVADGADAEGRRQIAVDEAGLVAGTEVDEVIAGAEPLDDAAAERGRAGLGAGQPVALAGGIAELVKELVGRKLAVDDDERGIGELRPERGGQGEFAVVEGAERRAP